MMSRVKYYNNKDLSIGSKLQLAETVLNHFDWGKPTDDINDVIELYNICQLIGSGCRLDSWDEHKSQELADMSKKLLEKIGRYCTTIGEENIQDLYNRTEVMYRDDFFTIAEKYKVFERIGEPAFMKFLECPQVSLRLVLEHSSIVKKYNHGISIYMKTHRAGAELLLSHFFAKHDNSRQLHVPEALTEEDICAIITDYINSEDANPNYLNLAAQKSSGNSWLFNLIWGQSKMTLLQYLG